MRTIEIKIPKLTIESFRKLVDKCKKNIPDFDYSVGKECEERFLHITLHDNGIAREYMMHPVFPVTIQFPEDNDWELLASYEDGLEFITDPSQKLVTSNPMHGLNYDHCDVCGRSELKNSYLIRNVKTGEELQVGCGCVKKYGLQFTKALSDFTRSLYQDFDARSNYNTDETPVWKGGSNRWAFSAIGKSDLICAAKRYYDEHPVWVKAYYDHDERRMVCSESANQIQRYLSTGDYELDTDYVEEVCRYTLSLSDNSDFTDNMRRVANNFYTTPNSACFAFYMVKKYEEYRLEQKLPMDAYPEGALLHVEGVLIDSQTEMSFYGAMQINTIKTESGILVKRVGKVPFVEVDGVKKVDFYAKIKYVEGIQITVDRALKRPAKGLQPVNI